jgi:hypothetical protein
MTEDYSDLLYTALKTGIDWDKPPPSEYLTEELCVEALKGAPRQLGRVPQALRTFEVCYTAVFQDDAALAFVPEPLREEVKRQKDAITVQKWLEMLSWHDCIGDNYSDYLFVLTEKLRTPDFCSKLVSLNGLALELVPNELKTTELCQAAVKENEEALQFVPKKIKEQLAMNNEQRKNKNKINIRSTFFSLFSVLCSLLIEVSNDKP